MIENNQQPFVQNSSVPPQPQTQPSPQTFPSSLPEWSKSNTWAIIANVIQWVLLVLFFLIFTRIPYVGSFFDSLFDYLFGLGRYVFYVYTIVLLFALIFKQKGCSQRMLQRRFILYAFAFMFLVGMLSSCLYAAVCRAIGHASVNHLSYFNQKWVEYFLFCNVYESFWNQCISGGIIVVLFIYVLETFTIWFVLIFSLLSLIVVTYAAIVTRMGKSYFRRILSKKIAQKLNDSLLLKQILDQGTKEKTESEQPRLVQNLKNENQIIQNEQLDQRLLQESYQQTNGEHSEQLVNNNDLFQNPSFFQSSHNVSDDQYFDFDPSQEDLENNDFLKPNDQNQKSVVDQKTDTNEQKNGNTAVDEEKKSDYRSDVKNQENHQDFFELHDETVFKDFDQNPEKIDDFYDEDFTTDKKQDDIDRSVQKEIVQETVKDEKPLEINEKSQESTEQDKQDILFVSREKSEGPFIPLNSRKDSLGLIERFCSVKEQNPYERYSQQGNHTYRQNDSRTDLQDNAEEQN